MLQGLGLEQVGTDVDVPFFNGGSPAAEFWRLTAEQLQPQMEAHGLLARQELVEATTLMRNPSAWLFGPAMVATWGRRPADLRVLEELPMRAHRGLLVSGHGHRVRMFESQIGLCSSEA